MTSDLTIDRVETWACSLPLPSALSFGNFTVTSRQYAAVRITTRCGLVADCLGHTRRSPVDVAIADLLAPRLVGKDAGNHGERLADLRRATLAIEDDGVIGRARSMVDICLWDLRAQALGVPVWQLLGGHQRQVRVGLVEGYEIEGEGEDDIAARLTARADEGYDFFKMEAAHYGEPRPIRRILETVRRSVPKAEFTCDLAWSWKTARQGLEAADLWQDLGIGWIEDPMPRTRVSEIAFLRQHSKVPIGLGDECTRPLDLENLMEREAIDVVRVDATTIGGFTAALSLAARAVSKGFRVSYHVNPEVHRHCVFADDAADHIEVFPADRPFDCSHMLIEAPAFADIERGHLSPPTAPGTGLRLNSDALAHYAYRHAIHKGD
ncbi:L-alanine-DL-glutamate epimerase-like enolase superfamily enzyme [Rhodoligotrophos appendicifer]|uniref:mandelate racemase/muconate lactonizing enzyme family protein n=1 Tax=Rhodoligotrophos appendicifer TaxID=987056 RepID=UPI00117F7128|nr:enolase C-terminal domain-like protein [Rhodoligotrophos appendicifer]